MKRKNPLSFLTFLHQFFCCVLEYFFFRNERGKENNIVVWSFLRRGGNEKEKENIDFSFKNIHPIWGRN